MEPRDRLLAAWRGQSCDRVPLALQGFDCASRDELSATDDPLRRKVAARVLDVLPFRVGVPSHINRMLVTPPQRIRTERRELGDGSLEVHGVIDTPRGELTYRTTWDAAAKTWWTGEYPVKTADDIEAIASVPWELPRDLHPAETDRLPAEFTRRGIMLSRISSPFVCVAGMMKFEQFLGMCVTDLPLLRNLAEVCLERILDCLEVLLSEPGIDCVWMGGSEWVTPPMASPAVYDALVQAQERAIIDYVHEHSDAIVHVHCHGNVRHALQRMVERGADYTEPVEPPPDGDITMAEAKALASGRITLGGNVEARILYNAPVEEVDRATWAAFEGGKDRFVLRATEGPSPRMSKREFENYMRLVDVWEDLSPIG